MFENACFKLTWNLNRPSPAVSRLDLNQIPLSTKKFNHKSQHFAEYEINVCDVFVRLNWKTWRMTRKCTFPTVVISIVKPQTSLCLLQKKTCVNDINSGRKIGNRIEMSSWTMLRFWFVSGLCWNTVVGRNSVKVQVKNANFS